MALKSGDLFMTAVEYISRKIVAVNTPLITALENVIRDLLRPFTNPISANTVKTENLKKVHLNFSHHKKDNSPINKTQQCFSIIRRIGDSVDRAVIPQQDTMIPPLFYTSSAVITIWYGITAPSRGR